MPPDSGNRQPGREQQQGVVAGIYEQVTWKGACRYKVGSASEIKTRLHHLYVPLRHGSRGRTQICCKFVLDLYQVYFFLQAVRGSTYFSAPSEVDHASSGPVREWTMAKQCPRGGRVRSGTSSWPTPSLYFSRP